MGLTNGYLFEFWGGGVLRSPQYRLIFVTIFLKVILRLNDAYGRSGPYATTASYVISKFPMRVLCFVG